jgi:hypothetical protein
MEKSVLPDHKNTITNQAFEVWLQDAEGKLE